MNDFIKKNKVTAAVMAVDLIIFLLMSCFFDPSTDVQMMLRFGACESSLVMRNHQYWRLLTACFLHFSIEHLIGNMTSLYAVGRNLEEQIGAKKFIIVYLVAGVLANFVSCYFAFSRGAGFFVSAGASGAIFGLFGAFLSFLILTGGVSAGSRSSMLVMIVFLVYLGYIRGGVDNTAHIAGAVIGFLLMFAIKPRKKKVCSDGQ